MDLHNRGAEFGMRRRVCCSRRILRPFLSVSRKRTFSVAPDTFESSYQFFVTRNIANTPTSDAAVFPASENRRIVTSARLPSRDGEIGDRRSRKKDGPLPARPWE